MPFCTGCGNQVEARTAYCAHCGRPQSVGRPAPGPAAAPGPFDSITPRTASTLCYIPIFGVIPAIIILASQRFRGNASVRFDAFQSVYLFVAWLIVSNALPLVFLGVPGWGLQTSVVGLLKLAFLICWIILLIKSSQNQQLRLPIIGDLAARSASEQL